MKYLNDYTQDAISKVIKDNGGFFAFSNKQFEENKQDGIKYVRLYGGLISPKNNVKNIQVLIIGYLLIVVQILYKLLFKLFVKLVIQ